MAKQREVLLKEREGIYNEQQALQERLDAVNEVLAKFDAFEGNSAKSRPQAMGRRPPRTREGSRREGILAVLADTPHGLTRGEIIDKLGLKGNKTGEMSVSNALTALTKQSQIARKDGKYVASAS
jgi:hypothetical protein